MTPRKTVVSALLGLCGLLVLSSEVLGQATWTAQSSGTSNTLLGVSFTDANTGTAVGDGGTILRTTDGGATWTRQSSGTTNSLRGVSFTDANTGTVVGEGGTILRTTDGGDNWISQGSGTTLYLSGVSFVDANTGTAVGGGSDEFDLLWVSLYTTDGGATWTQTRIPSNYTGFSLYGVSLADANRGTAVGTGYYYELGGYGVIMRTTNRGADWTFQHSTPFVYPYGVSFGDANTGTIVGSEGTILRTTDGGATWVPQTAGTTADLYGVSFADPNTGTAVGDGGTILRTTDGGATWTPQTSGTTNYLIGVSFVDANTGTAVGGSGTVLRTTTGGGGLNYRPVSSFTLACSGLTCTFNGSPSSDSDGTIASYGWQFGDGTAASGATATHTFAAGHYDVQLTVMDDDGAVATSVQGVAIFKLNTDAALMTLHTFTGGADGGNPYTGVIQTADGSFYGRTTSGGTSNAGTIFKLDALGTMTTLHDFGGNSTVRPRSPG